MTPSLAGSDHGFRFGANANRCAITRVQLRLVDAAQILPISAPGSSNHVRNGIAFAPSYQRALDAGLIYPYERHRMMLNEVQLHALERVNLGGGMETFRARLGERMFPASRSTAAPLPRLYPPREQVAADSSVRCRC